MYTHSEERSESEAEREANSATRCQLRELETNPMTCPPHMDKPRTASSCEQSSSRIIDGVPLAKAVPQ